MATVDSWTWNMVEPANAGGLVRHSMEFDWFANKVREKTLKTLMRT